MAAPARIGLNALLAAGYSTVFAISAAPAAVRSLDENATGRSVRLRARGV
jgi:hypothetical protein